ncbi:hypothetical protein [Serratia marcescens]|uniref:hypothetical protein n=1 Tax=Serratia marcescens TaxID=615 RepID=UPI0011E79117|nr:hypothetical protein [Serratia marcescens]
MVRENRPDAINKRHHAHRLLHLRLPDFGRIIAAGLERRTNQFTLAFVLFMFSGDAMANHREHQQTALAGMTCMARPHHQGSNWV